jgi:tetracycline repressor-like protein
VRISLEQVVDSATPELPTTRALIRAFIAPFIDLLRHEEPGWAYYIKLISHVLTLYHVDPLRETIESLNDISELFIERLRLIHPEMDDKSFFAALYAIEAVMGFMVQDPGFLDNLTLNHYHSAEMDKLLDHLVPFLAGGVEATARSGL